MSSRWVTPRGTGGVQAATNNQMDATKQQQAWNAEDRTAKKPIWNQFLATNQQMAPVYGSMAEWLKGNYDPQTVDSGAPGPVSGISAPSWMRTPDWQNTGQQVQDAYLTSSNQSIADQYKTLGDQITAHNAMSGLSQTSFAPGGMAALAVQRSQDQARAAAGALTQRLGAEQALRAEGNQSYYQQLAALQQYINNLYSMGDTSGNTALLGNIASGYGNAANSFGQIGQNQAAGLAGIASLAGQNPQWFKFS